MADKWENFAQAQKDVEQARQNLAVANGGSTKAHITQSNNAKWVADLKAEAAYDDLFGDEN